MLLVRFVRLAKSCSQINMALATSPDGSFQFITDADENNPYAFIDGVFMLG